MKQLLLFCLLFMLVSPCLADTTWVSGIVDGQTWTTANSPYCVTDSIRVGQLTIEPGVEVVFFGKHPFDVPGILTATGTESDSIVFRQAHVDSARWWGIFFDQSASASELAYCRIEGSQNSAIRIDLTEVSIHNCLITDNISYVEGPGIYVIDNPYLHIYDCSFTNNHNGGIGSTDYCNGGAIRAVCDSIFIQGCTFYGNSVEGQRNHRGGALYVTGYLDMFNCMVRNNTAHNRADANTKAYGGGINIVGSARITNCVIDSNEAYTYSDWSGVNWSPVTRGGGIYVDGDLTIKNSVVCNNNIVAANEASGRTREGGGIYCTGSGGVLIENVTASYNAYQELFNYNSTVAVINSILWDDAAGQLSGTMDISWSCYNGSDGTNHNTTDNPSFYGTDNFELLSMSPCIDGGNDSSHYNDECFPPSKGTVINDMGVYGGPGACGWMLPPDVLPTIFDLAVDVDTVDFCGISYVGYHLPITGYTSVDVTTGDAADAYWTNDTLYFMPDTLDKTYSLDVEAANATGSRIRTVNVHIVCLDDVTEVDGNAIPGEFALFQNSPNPFNPATTIGFNLPRRSQVTLDIYNILGQKMISLANESLDAGTYEVEWNGCDASGRSVASGIYFYRMKADMFVETRKMVLMK